MKKTTLALIFSSLALSSAMGQATPIQPVFLQQQKHSSYLNSVSIGRGIEVGTNSAAVPNDLNESEGGFEISLDHQLNKKMAIEIRGSCSGVFFDRSTTSVSITAKGILHISSHTQLIGKVGAAHVNTKYSSIFSTPQSPRTSFAPEVGIGVGFDLTAHINTSLEYNAAITSSEYHNYYNGPIIQTGPLPMGLASLNVSYKF